MLNTFVLVGAVTGVPTYHRTKIEFTVTCDRSFREEGGMKTQDSFTVYAWKGIGDEIASLLRYGVIVAVKGRLRMEEGKCILMAEHISIERNMGIQGM